MRSQQGEGIDEASRRFVDSSTDYLLRLEAAGGRGLGGVCVAIMNLTSGSPAAASMVVVAGSSRSPSSARMSTLLVLVLACCSRW